MAAVLRSFLTGKWVAVDGDAVPLLHAATGDEVTVTNQDDAPVATYDVLTLVAKLTADSNPKEH